MTGIIGAMTIEVENLIAKMSDTKSEKIAGVTYVSGRYGEREIVVARCGMGKVNAAICAQTMILKYAPEVIINTGVAGAVSPLLKIHDLVIAKSAVQHDMDLTPIGLKRGFIQELNTIFIPCAPEVVAALKAAAKNTGETYYTGAVATGDAFINCDETRTQIFNNFDALACEMEGAAIAHVCAANGVKCGIVRTISDNSNSDSEFDFNEFLKEAAEKSVRIISGFLSNL